MRPGLTPVIGCAWRADPTLGARPMKRTIARLVEAPLAEKILRGELSPKSIALLSVEGDVLECDVLDAASSAAE